MSNPFDDAVVIALGSNLPGAYPSSEALLDAATAELERAFGPALARSSWWPNPAEPPGSGPDFLNGVALFAPVLEPRPTLERLHEIERAFGRERGAPNAPRTLDLDLIAHGRRIDPVGPPILPHPRARARRFVMGPLAEVAPAWRDPVGGLTAPDLADQASLGTDAEIASTAHNG